jgi:hypothetical protein
MLQYLQNKFLIERVATVRGLSTGQGLLKVALEMMDICLMFWTERDELMIFSSSFDWIVSTLLYSHVNKLIRTIR